MEPNVIQVMEDLTQEAVEVLQDMLEQDVKPIVEYRKKLENQIATKAINELYKLEEDEI